MTSWAPAIGFSWALGGVLFALIVVGMANLEPVLLPTLSYTVTPLELATRRILV